MIIDLIGYFDRILISKGGKLQIKKRVRVSEFLWVKKCESNRDEEKRTEWMSEFVWLRERARERDRESKRDRGRYGMSD